MALTQADLKDVACAKEGCGCTPRDSMMMFRSTCHTEAPVWAGYRNGMVSIFCSECSRPVADIAVEAGRWADVMTEYGFQIPATGFHPGGVGIWGTMDEEDDQKFVKPAEFPSEWASSARDNGVTPLSRKVIPVSPWTELP